ncbi:hypothetical protein ASE04_21185 [Rhizobium sp. Root708]|uniref:hypothetical protein n=1 Tax=Rhizobium sp. Root708 TaxID=1736592 RepID=UPI0006FE6ADF|nr:hypothetical protein [Rhizobium sp. Root708]KRB61383.1 hypothetical protein ASE04_21185 [Rhizobium sp. Root708]
MSDKIQLLIDRRERVQSDIAELVAADVASVLAGSSCQFSDSVSRLAHEVNILDAAIERLRSLA